MSKANFHCEVLTKRKSRYILGVEIEMVGVDEPIDHVRHFPRNAASERAKASQRRKA